MAACSSTGIYVQRFRFEIRRKKDIPACRLHFSYFSLMGLLTMLFVSMLLEYLGLPITSSFAIAREKSVYIVLWMKRIILKNGAGNVSIPHFVLRKRKKFKNPGLSLSLAPDSFSCILAAQLVSISMILKKKYMCHHEPCKIRIFFLKKIIGISQSKSITAHPHFLDQNLRWSYGYECPDHFWAVYHLTACKKN